MTLPDTNAPHYWYERAKLAEARIRELEAALTIIASYTGHDEAALVAKQLAQGALNRKGESK